MTAQQLRTYSFLDIQATITGPGGSFSLAADSASAKEGITIAPAVEIGTMTIGADGSVMHVLHADNSGRITARFLKTSPRNQQLMAMFNLQKASSLLWGNNLIMISSATIGDSIQCVSVAFTKAPDLVYDDAGPMLEWAFNAGIIARVLGS